MINISNELKQAFLLETVKKNIKLEFEDKTDFSKVNFWPYVDGSTAVNISDVNLADGFALYWLWIDSLINNYIQYAKYLKIKGVLGFSYSKYSSDETTPNKVKIGIRYRQKNTSEIVNFVSGNMYDVPNYDELDDERWINFEEIYSIEDLGIEAILRFPFFKIYDENGNPATSGHCYMRAGRRDFEISLAMKVSDLPYSNTVKVEALGLNPDDYITITTIQKPELYNEDIESESLLLTESLSSRESLKFGACEGARLELTLINNEDQLAGKYFKAYISAEGINERISLGRFKVDSETLAGTGNVIRKKIVAYDGMEALNMDATDWYTKYMQFMTYDIYSSGKSYKFARQMFATFANICEIIGLEVGIHEKVNGQRVVENSYSEVTSRAYLTENLRIAYQETPAIYLAPNTMYKIEFPQVPSGTTYSIWRFLTQNVDNFDAPKGIFPDRAGILIEEMSGNDYVGGILLDNGDVFITGPDTDRIRVAIPAIIEIMEPGQAAPDQQLQIDSAFGYPTITEYEFDGFASDNFHAPLVYYNWQTKEVGQASGVTVRDIIRSLLEITAYFMKFDRDGHLVFKKLETSGANIPDLPANKFGSFTKAGFTTADYGRIQIKINDAAQGASSVKTYVGSTSENTYIIDDNVFYCASGVSYDTLSDDGGLTWFEPHPEVLEMMANLFAEIGGLAYKPYTADTVGQPWMEAGDRMNLILPNETMVGFILARDLTGIQFLRDAIEARGEEEQAEIPNYGIVDWKQI